jgi:hypothetical protein
VVAEADRELRAALAAVFPKEWAMDERLAEEFCSQTKLSIAANLQEHRERLDVTVLVAALQQCLGFEKRLCERFTADAETTEAEAAAAGRAAAAGVDSGDDEPNGAAAAPEEGEQELDDPALQQADVENPHTVDAVRRRFARFKREQRRADRAKQKTRADAKRREEKFAGMISSAFHPYLDLYIAQEEKQLGELLEKLIAQEKWEFDDESGAHNRVLQSATDLVYYFKKCRSRCAALNKGQTLYELFLLLRRTLYDYAGYLSRQLPSDMSKPLTLDDERRFCIIINTAEYCSQTAARVADGFKRLIIPKFHPQLDVTGAQTEFSSVIAKTTKVLVSHVAALLTPALLTMQKLPWATLPSVGDTSEYVADIARVIVEHVPTYNLYLSEQHAKYFADQFVADIVPRLIQSIYKTKRISEAGAQHLLLDMSVIKTTLLRLPEIGRQSANAEDGDPAHEDGDGGDGRRAAQGEDVALRQVCQPLDAQGRNFAQARARAARHAARQLQADDERARRRRAARRRPAARHGAQGRAPVGAAVGDEQARGHGRGSARRQPPQATVCCDRKHHCRQVPALQDAGHRGAPQQAAPQRARAQRLTSDRRRVA